MAKDLSDPSTEDKGLCRIDKSKTEKLAFHEKMPGVIKKLLHGIAKIFRKVKKNPTLADNIEKNIDKLITDNKKTTKSEKIGKDVAAIAANRKTALEDLRRKHHFFKER